METNATSMVQGGANAQPRFSAISHVSLPCHDLDQAKIFCSRVMGGEWVHEIAGFVEYKIADVIIGLAEQRAGWTGRDDEYPHYAFYIDGANFALMKSWLKNHGVPNYPYRRDKTALIYFRDPSGNLFELYCDSGYENIDSLPPAPRRGGPAIDFRALNYRWDGARAFDGNGQLGRPRFTGFAHASVYCHDLEQAKSFFTRVMGGELIHDVDNFAEVGSPGSSLGSLLVRAKPPGGMRSIRTMLFSSNRKIFCRWCRGCAATASSPPSRGRGTASKGFSIFATRRETFSRCIAGI
jgi:catechol 2,3-dioxygenase-like lactoylglutathione lyase family enzyme